MAYWTLLSGKVAASVTARMYARLNVMGHENFSVRRYLCKVKENEESKFKSSPRVVALSVSK